MATPSTIARLEPLPAIAVDLLDRIASHTIEEPHLLGVLGAQPELLAEISHVAMQANGSQDHATPDAETLLKQLSSLRLTEIVMTVLVGSYLRRAIRVSDDDRYWRYILACAVCCEQVARPKQEDALLAYTAGLFHDIGRMALIAAHPNRYSNLLALTDRMFAENEPFDILEYERLLFGLDHFETGIWIAKEWNLPSWLHAIVGKFDGQTKGEHARLVATVRAGTSLAHSLGFGYLAAAPRGDIRKILSHCEDSEKHRRTSEDWEYVEEHMRGKVRVCLRWYTANE